MRGRRHSPRLLRNSVLRVQPIVGQRGEGSRTLSGWRGQEGMGE
jgi:hypothetical protein